MEALGKITLIYNIGGVGDATGKVILTQAAGTSRVGSLRSSSALGGRFFEVQKIVHVLRDVVGIFFFIVDEYWWSVGEVLGYGQRTGISGQAQGGTVKVGCTDGLNESNASNQMQNKYNLIKINNKK